MWQLAKFGLTEEAAVAAFNSQANHQWYLDPTTVIFCLANDHGITNDEKKQVAITLSGLDRPAVYNFDRSHKTGFAPSIEVMQSLPKPPSLSNFVGPELWLIFDIIGQTSAQAKWLKFPVEDWPYDED